jgi:RNA polymerase sigma-70 factor (ECF subfamily)
MSIPQVDTVPNAEPSFHDLLLAALPGLRQQALALTRNRADADDLVQSAVTNALAAKDSFAVGTNFNAWTSRILRNRFVSNVRRRREIVDIDDAPAALLARSGGQAERMELLELRRCMLRLPPNQRIILLLVSVQGLSYEEASAQLGVAVGTLKCRVFRARSQLAAWMLGETAPAAPSRAARPAAAGKARNSLRPAAPAH